MEKINYNQLDKANIKIGNCKYTVLLAKTEAEREYGLMGVSELDNDEGMLFIHPNVENVNYWMHDCDIPLSIIFIDSDKEVISVKEGTPNTDDYISENNVKYVLEVNPTKKIETGDILEIDGEDDFSEDEIELEPNKMYIIGSDGTPQAELQGGERIFSRKSTRVILRKAKKAFETKVDADYRALGRYVFNELTAQTSRKPQYVESKV